MRLASVGALLCVLVSSACSLETELVVESDTAWSGNIAQQPVSGRGNATFDITQGDGTEVCWLITKSTDAGTLRAYTKEESATGGTEIHNVQVTTAAGGSVEGCTE